MRLAREGKLITHHTDKAVLTLMNLESIIDRNYTPVEQTMPLGRLVHVMSMSNTAFIPVLDPAGTLLGEVDLAKIRNVMFRIELYHHFTVAQLMTPPAATLGVNDPMEDVMRKFEETEAAVLPVIDHDGRLIGYISRARMYAMYRKMVADMSAE